MRFSMTSKATSNSFSRFSWTTPLEPGEAWRIKAKQARPKLRNKSSVRCNKILILGCWVNVVRRIGGQEFAIVPLSPQGQRRGRLSFHNTQILRSEKQVYKSALLSRRALVMTDTELNVMATLAMMGLSKSPKNG